MLTRVAVWSFKARTRKICLRDIFTTLTPLTPALPMHQSETDTRTTHPILARNELFCLSDFWQEPPKYTDIPQIDNPKNHPDLSRLHVVSDPLNRHILFIYSFNVLGTWFPRDS